ncbi:hypothetical protein U9M48_044528 [Paspalum notatum var. saurae]|uniref:Small auxin up regulated protein n=1 Tax=Paspalum notatum var. saurae TaxID=547442 RepID=A0AAQ3UVW8_PASNO
MICSKRITQLTKKWQRMTSLGRKHLIWETEKEFDECCASVAGKGHRVVYTADGRRFEVPLSYLGNKVFEELLRMSQEEFGFTGDGRITLPCDASTMEYAMCLLRRSVSVEVEKAFLSTMEVTCNYASDSGTIMLGSQLPIEALMLGIQLIAFTSVSEMIASEQKPNKLFL